MDEDAAGVGRRELLRGTAAGTTAAVATTATTGSAAAQSEQVMVGSDDAQLEFTPDSLTIEPGTTVTFEWGTAGHNIVVDSQPDDAEWEGHPEVVDPPNTYEYTFEVEGSYDYFCEPHVSSGMEGTIEVSADAGGGGGGSSGPPPLPDSARSVGIGLITAMASTLGIAYFFLKYGGSPEST